jgi:hypothetical protein
LQQSIPSTASENPTGNKLQKLAGLVLPLITAEFTAWCQVGPNSLSLAAGTKVPLSYVRWALDTELRKVSFLVLPEKERGEWMRAAFDSAGRAYGRLLVRAVEQAKSELPLQSTDELKLKEVVREALYHAVEQHEFPLYFSTVDLSLFEGAFWPAARRHICASLKLPHSKAADDSAYQKWWLEFVFG